MPHGADLHALASLWPVFQSCVISFIYIGSYWNHHHLIHAVTHVHGAILWANLHLLSWLSLIPFVTGWMGENRFATIPVAAYGVVLFMCAIAYALLVRCLTSRHGQNPALAEAIGSDKKGRLSLVRYLLGVALAFVNAWLGFGIYVVVALVWVVPDRRIEDRFGGSPPNP